MSRMLEKLFDYQRFEGNKDLQQVIDSVHAKYTTRELTPDDLEMVNAAGMAELPLKNRQNNEEK